MIGLVPPAVLAEREDGWRAAPAEPSLSGDRVHVWRASTDRPAWPVEWLEGTLSGNERRRADRFHTAPDRRRFVVRRGVLRAILARYLRVAPDRLELGVEGGGKPALVGPSTGAQLTFNCSHSHGLALYAMARGRAVGVDLEKMRPLADADRILEWICAPAERSALSALGPAERLAAFFRCWTRKEAWVKAHGDGLARELAGVEVSVAPDEPARLERLDGDPRAAARWSLATLHPAEGYAGALAVEGRGWRLACWEASA